MTYITQLTGRRTTSILQITTMTLIAAALLVLQSTSVQAQWTTPDGQGNINNTNSGKVGVGAAPTAPLTLTTPGNTLDGTYYSSFTIRKTGDTFSGIRFDKNSTALFRIGTDPNNNFQISRLVGTGSPDDGAFVMSQSGYVGIGVSSPALPLDVRGNSISIGTGAAARALIGNYDLTSMAQGVGGGLQFGGKYNSGGTISGFASISGIKENATDNDFSSALVFTTRSMPNPQTEKMRISSTGNVGIGTTTPGEFVHVRKDQNAATHLMVENTTAGASALADLQLKNDLSHLAQFGLYSSTTTTAGALASGNAFAYTTSPAMVIMANNASGIIKFATGGLGERMRIDASGNVGIGISNPTSKLDVNGNTNVTGNLNVTATITGGTINAKYQDVAEWVHSSQQLSAGTVVVLDHTKSNQVIASSQAYDTRVAGVISLQPGITLGEDGAGKVLVATTGRVKVRVDATAGPIEVGDLLVTSDKEGIAKKSEALSLGGVQIHRPGTLIGKALEPLEKGTGEILVLLSLQ